MQLHRFSTTIELNIDSFGEAESGIVSDVVVGAGFEVGRFVFCIGLYGRSQYYICTNPSRCLSLSGVRIKRRELDEGE